MKRNMALSSIEEGDLQAKSIIPDTPMFKHLRQYQLKFTQKQISESLSQETLKQYTSEDQASLRQVSHDILNRQNKAHSPTKNSVLKDLTNLQRHDKAYSAESSTASSICRSKSTLDISADRQEIDRLRRANYANQKIIMELTATVKHLQSKLSCYEMSTNELRLQLLEKNAECQTLNEVINAMRLQKNEQVLVLKKQVMLLQDKVKASQEITPMLQIFPKSKEIPCRHTLVDSSIEVVASKQSSKVHSSGSSFKLKSFRNSLSNLRHEQSSEHRQSMVQQKEEAIRNQLQILECKVEHLSDQQKLLKFKNKLLEMKIK